MDKQVTFLKIDDKNIHSYKIKLLQTLNFYSDIGRASRERGLLEEIIKLTQKNKTDISGLVALSASSVDDIPVVQVDYLFVDYKFRKTHIKVIDNTISKYL